MENKHRKEFIQESNKLFKLISQLKKNKLKNNNAKAMEAENTRKQ